MIRTSCAVVVAPTLDRALARWRFTVECESPSRWAAALSEPAARTAAMSHGVDNVDGNGSIDGQSIWTLYPGDVYIWDRRVRPVGTRGRILRTVVSSTNEVEMDTARPRAIGPAQRTVATGPATAGMVREQAFAADDRWVGVVRTEPGVQSGWHHHGDTDSYFYVLSGAMELEFGPGGRDRLRVVAGDFVHVPHGLIHREGTPPDQPAEVALVRFGSGAPVVNVEGPEPE